VYLRSGDFLVSCLAQLTSRKARTYMLGFSSDQVLCSRIVRFIVIGHDGILSVDGALPAPIVPHTVRYSNPRARAIGTRMRTRSTYRDTVDLTGIAVTPTMPRYMPYGWVLWSSSLR
jgi:hypothetical protein